MRVRKKRIPFYQFELMTIGKRDEGRPSFMPRFKSVDLNVLMDENLTKTQKSYIMLYYNDKKSVIEIAEMFGVNKSTVSRTISRARSRIEKVFSGFAS